MTTPKSIPDHPDVAYALHFGYPNPSRRNIRCTCCERTLNADETVYLMDREDLCNKCFVLAVIDNYSADEFAQVLDVRSCSVMALIEERYDG